MNTHQNGINHQIQCKSWQITSTMIQSLKVKILKQVEYESARRKSILMKKQEKEMRKALHFLYVHLSFLFCRKWQQKVNF